MRVTIHLSLSAGRTQQSFRYFHVTSLEALPSITFEGLRPSKVSRNSRVSETYIPNAIFFSSTLKSAKAWIEMLAENDAEAMSKLCILAVDLTGYQSQLKVDHTFNPLSTDEKLDAFYLKSVTIPAERILKVYKTAGAKKSAETALSDSFNLWSMLDLAEGKAPWIKSKKTSLEAILGGLTPKARALLVKKARKVQGIDIYTHKVGLLLSKMDKLGYL